MLPVAVVGGGAAGLMAAIFAANAGRRVVLLETTRDGGRKILISGGGRCNVLPSTLSPTQFVSTSSPNTLKKILLSWPLSEQRRYFEQVLGIELVQEQATGKLFPSSNSARQVRDALVERARSAGAELRFNSPVRDLVPATRDSGWRLHVGDGTVLEAAAVIVATGGMSVPATGSDGAGLRLLETLGHAVNDTYPALTPLTAEPAVHGALAGVSLDVILEAPTRRGRFTSRGGFLFTHRGYSGPAVLNISHLAVRSRLAGAGRQPIYVQWTELDTAAWDAELRSAGAGQVGPLVKRHLPDRLAEALLAEADVPPGRLLAELRREERQRLVTVLTRYPLPWTGDEGYRKAEVTGGGVALDQVHVHSLESRHHRGLFLCGEVLDAFGPIGGYNFAWAWATGRAAGISAAAAGSAGGTE
ncbi:MAG TPA: aminoacetone oxidase family FAD-binding enzyme [Longimicrobiales bacterium]|nr:aminoacetone oxidase family FAD-binding enzyme [Longimicrobiales bacterium]